ncbi:MAG: carotenoid oxygenase family protein [Pseudomonadota bacterium]
MPTTIANTFIPTIGDNDHPYRNGAWTPNYVEYDANELKVTGEIPRDLNGLYVRNTENPMHEAIGVYHPFDGDGMIHAMRFQDGKAFYRNRFVRTEGFLAELQEGRALWAGITADPSLSEREGWGARGGMKDASSTDVVIHNKKVLSTFYQCGDAYRLDSTSLDTLGKESWVPGDGISAHPKVDLATGELLFFNYSKQAPYMHYGVVSANGELKHFVPIPLPGPRLPHDMAFTKNYSILCDFPLFWDPKLLEKNIHAARFYADTPSRFAVIPRYGDSNEVRWFEADPTFVLHFTNAFEQDNEIILDGYFQQNPEPGPLEGAPRKYARMMGYLDLHSMQPRFHRWRFNLKTGAVTETDLDEKVLEFGTINQTFAGREARYSYSTTGEPGHFLLNGFVKHDLHKQSSDCFAAAAGEFVSEASFAPRTGAIEEDDGFLVSFTTNLREDISECIVMDARNLSAGPICRIQLPHRICSGTHAAWAGEDEL